MKQNDKRFGKYLTDKTAIKSALLAPTNHNLNMAIESSIETPPHSFAKPTPFFAKHNTNHGAPPRKPAFLHDLFTSLPFRWKTHKNRTYNGSSHQIVKFQTVISFESCSKWFEFFLTYCTIQTRRDWKYFRFNHQESTILRTFIDTIQKKKKKKNEPNLNKDSFHLLHILTCALLSIF